MVIKKARSEDTAYKIANEIDAKKRIVVGVNEFTDGASASPPLMVIDAEIGRAQRARLAERKGFERSSRSKRLPR